MQNAKVLDAIGMIPNVAGCLLILERHAAVTLLEFPNEVSLDLLADCARFSYPRLGDVNL